MYDNIVETPAETPDDGQGFNDAYADFIFGDSEPCLNALCNTSEDDDVDDVDKHCTVDVTSFSPPSLDARRIDFIFIKNFSDVTSAQVVFNEAAPGGVGPSVSDHAAVVTSLLLPEPE